MKMNGNNVILCKSACDGTSHMMTAHTHKYKHTHTYQVLMNRATRMASVWL